MTAGTADAYMRALADNVRYYVRHGCGAPIGRGARAADLLDSICLAAWCAAQDQSAGVKWRCWCVSTEPPRQQTLIFLPSAADWQLYVHNDALYVDERPIMHTHRPFVAMTSELWQSIVPDAGNGRVRVLTIKRPKWRSVDELAALYDWLVAAGDAYDVLESLGRFIRVAQTASYRRPNAVAQLNHRFAPSVEQLRTAVNVAFDGWERRRTDNRNQPEFDEDDADGQIT